MIKSDLVKCCVCQKTIAPRLVLKNKRDGWDIMRCPQCDLAFIHPQPPLGTISAYYNGMYSDLAAEFSDKKMEWAKRSVKGYCAHLAATVVDWLLFPVRLLLEHNGMASGISIYARKDSNGE